MKEGRFDDLKMIELVEKYLENKLDDAEKKDFELRLNTDNQFRKEVDDIIYFLGVLRKSAERNIKKRKLEQLHEEIQKENKIFPLNYFYRKKNIIVQFTKIAAVAAVVALITTFIFLNSTGIISKFYHLEKYNELKKEIVTISKKQNSLWKALFNNQKNDIVYSGTCFAISKDGCLATSYHLIEGFDSLIIINELDSALTFKVKILFTDPVTDLAILKITDSSFTGFNEIPYGFADYQVPLGEEVFTMGYSKKDIVYSEGALRSSSGFNCDTLAYEVSVPVNPGNSGSPLLDSKGNLIGIITARDDNNNGSAYAVKSMFLKQFIERKNKESESDVVELSTRNKIKDLKRTSQVSKIRPYIFRLEVGR